MLVGALGASAEALSITGGFSWSGAFVPVKGATGAVASLGGATGVDFIPSGPIVPTPGVPGPFLVNQASGTFNTIGDGGSLIGDTGYVKDFSFAGTGSANYPLVPIDIFESVSGVTFDLKTILVEFRNRNALVFSGTGIFKISGFDDTEGTFLFSGNTGGGTFSFSASNANDAPRVPDAGSTLTLLALGLMGMAAIRHTFWS